MHDSVMIPLARRPARASAAAAAGAGPPRRPGLASGPGRPGPLGSSGIISHVHIQFSLSLDSVAEAVDW